MILRLYVDLDTKDERNKGLTIGNLQQIEADMQQAVYERGGYVKDCGVENLDNKRK